MSRYRTLSYLKRFAVGLGIAASAISPKPAHAQTAAEMQEMVDAGVESNRRWFEAISAPTRRIMAEVRARQEMDRLPMTASNKAIPEFGRSGHSGKVVARFRGVRAESVRSLTGRMLNDLTLSSWKEGMADSTWEFFDDGTFVVTLCAKLGGDPQADPDFGVIKGQYTRDGSRVWLSSEVGDVGMTGSYARSISGVLDLKSGRSPVVRLEFKTQTSVHAKVKYGEFHGSNLGSVEVLATLGPPVSRAARPVAAEPAAAEPVPHAEPVAASSPPAVERRPLRYADLVGNWAIYHDTAVKGPIPARFIQQIRPEGMIAEGFFDTAGQLLSASLYRAEVVGQSIRLTNTQTNAVLWLEDVEKPTPGTLRFRFGGQVWNLVDFRS